MPNLKSLIILKEVYCAILETPATKKIIPSHMKGFAKQILKNATQTIKSLLTFQPTKTLPNVLPNMWPLK